MLELSTDEHVWHAVDDDNPDRPCVLNNTCWVASGVAARSRSAHVDALGTVGCRCQRPRARLT